MAFVEATLVKRYVDQVHEPCGMPLMELKDDIPLGKIYRVNLETRTRKALYNTEHHYEWACEMVQADNGEWLPTELLMREGKAL